MAGEATELPLPPTQRFPLHEENALIYDHNDHIVEDNIRAAIPERCLSIRLQQMVNTNEKAGAPPPSSRPL